MPRDEAINEFWRRCLVVIEPMNKAKLARQAGIHKSSLRQFLKTGNLGPGGRNALARILFGKDSWIDVVAEHDERKEDREEMDRLNEDLARRLGLLEGRLLGRIDYLQQQVNDLLQWRNEIQRTFPFPSGVKSRRP